MRKENKHYLLKLIILGLIVFGVWVLFWSPESPKTVYQKELANDILQN